MKIELFHFNEMQELLDISIKRLVNYCEHERFRGYDPYDTLNSFLSFGLIGKWGPLIAIQIQKRNPINIRPLIGIQKEINPKGAGLFLKAYCILYKITSSDKYLEKAHDLFRWLNANYSQGYSGHAWGYNFDWASPGSYVKAHTPSVVVTSFVVDGIYEYYKLTKDLEARKIIISSAHYILKDIPVTETEEGISFAYTHLSTGNCYNASLLAAEILAKADNIDEGGSYSTLIHKSIDFVLSKQNTNGSWYYSYDPILKKERKQIDFHQGFILVSLLNLKNLLVSPRNDVKDALGKGLEYYRKYQFFDNGRSLWRMPRKWPIDIHNQSQGIITFSRLKNYHPSYISFANTIAYWTIKNMQSRKGYFYYRKTPLFINKTPYIRWSQAWMMLALTELFCSNESE